MVYSITYSHVIKYKTSETISVCKIHYFGDCKMFDYLQGGFITIKQDKIG